MSSAHLSRSGVAALSTWRMKAAGLGEAGAPIANETASTDDDDDDEDEDDDDDDDKDDDEGNDEDEADAMDALKDCATSSGSIDSSAAMRRNTSSSVVSEIPYEPTPMDFPSSPSNRSSNGANDATSASGSTYDSSRAAFESRREPRTAVVTSAVNAASVVPDFSRADFSSPPDLSGSLFSIVRWYPRPKRFLRNSEEPQHFSRPRLMMAMRSHNKSASSMKCVVSTVSNGSDGSDESDGSMKCTEVE